MAVDVQFGKELCNHLPSLIEPGQSLVMSARDDDIEHPAVKDMDASLSKFQNRFCSLTKNAWGVKCQEKTSHCVFSLPLTPCSIIEAVIPLGKILTRSSSNSVGSRPQGRLAGWSPQVEPSWS